MTQSRPLEPLDRLPRSDVSPDLSRPPALRYAVAVGAAVLAILLTTAFWPVFRGIPFMPAFLAIFVSGWFGGGGPAFLTALLGAIGVAWLIFSPEDLAAPDRTIQMIRLTLFVAVSGLASILQAQLSATRRHRRTLLEGTRIARRAAAKATAETDRILESIADGFCSIDRSYRYAYVNRQAESILGRRREDLVGKSALEEMGAGDDPRTVGALRRAMEERQPTHLETFSPFFQRWFEAEIYPTDDGIAAMFRDVTERKRHEEGMQLLAAIVESSDDAILSKRLDGTVTSWNAGAQRLFGYTAEEMIGRPVSVLMRPEDRGQMNQIIDRIRSGGSVEHFETIRLTKAGEPVVVSLAVSPVKDAAGNIVGAAKIARNVTEQIEMRKERERLLQQAQAAVSVRDEFLSVAGHELRTPLTALKFQLHTLRRRIEGGQADRALEVAERASMQFERLARLTEELLDVTRITSGRMDLARERMDLAELVREVTERQAETALRAGSRLDVETSTDAEGFWDRSRLDQVTTNLISNAVKFGAGRPIEVRVEPDTDVVRLVVRDQGIGISPEDQSKVFERFERAVSTRSYGGLGLGLWISREIVEAHGGRILVESRPGAGATFVVELPR